MATVIIYRDHVGYQPPIPDSRVHAFPVDYLDIKSYFHKGVLVLPVLPWTPDTDDFGNHGTVSQFYLGLNRYSYEFVQLDSDGIRFMSFAPSKRHDLPFVTNSPICTTHTLHGVFSDSQPFADFLHGLIAVNATIEQIDQFTQEYACGTGSKIIWTPMRDLISMVDASKSSKESLRKRLCLPDPIRVTTPTFGDIVPIQKPKPKRNKPPCTRPSQAKTSAKPSTERKQPQKGSRARRPSTAKNT